LVGEPARGDALIRQSLTSLDRRFAHSKFWRSVVHDGFLDEEQPKASVNPWPSATADPVLADVSPDALEVVVSYSPATHDGRFANNGWLQETPDAVSKLTWDNAATMSPATAAKLNVKHGDVVRITAGRGEVELPVFELPGVAAGSIQLTLGYGRTAAGHVGGLVDEDVAPVGVDVSVLLATGNSRVLTDVRLEPTGRTHQLATTQDHFAIDTVGLEAIGARVGELVRTGTLAEYEQHADFAKHRGPHHPPLESLWEEKEYDGHAWGMAIDLNRCIGCNACMVGCQSENNVPIVGKEQVLDGREMHWLRIDRYFAGEPDDPEVAHQPLACHHCENAPCEQVCPVAATVHSDEGLNDMVYNRCIGTRYCANNCPYKVRRFNFFDYNAPLEEPGKELVQLSINPDVTVRSRGVMEKCTYCVQRIQDTKIDAKNGQRSVADGEIQTACQQACPAEAIVFGDLNDGNSKVAQLHADNRAYGMLAELNTKPRTMYLARIRNPHPWLDDTPEHDHHGSHAAHADGAAGHAEHEGTH
ncbi:MAG: 4Fe-4S dicluster domain-containing protein, partial [Planctomycetaceae bacterium]|nr:4Fe-4S dicluster domain-containing protein [Planctomycetaceae bacterium]